MYRDVMVYGGASLANAAKPHLASLCAAKRRAEREAFCPRLAGGQTAKENSEGILRRLPAPRVNWYPQTYLYLYGI